MAQLFIAILHLDRREPELALQRVVTAEAVAAEQRLAFFMEPRFLHGAALTEQGTFAEAIACLREVVAAGRGATCFVHTALPVWPKHCCGRANKKRPLAAVQQGLQVQNETGQGWWHAELHRLEGLALVGLNRVEEGQSALNEALRVARRQQAKSYELRAVTSLARMWGEQGRRAEAHELLAPVYGWFTEGFNTADLKEAKGLLDELT